MAKIYFDGKPCKHGHTDGRYIRCKQCVRCVKLRAARLYATPKGKASALARARAWEENNLELVAQLKRNDYRTNKAKWSERNKAWKRNNKAGVAAYTQRRRSLKKQAYPIWVDPLELFEFYEQALYLTNVTGIKHAVDHIVPLKNSKVCGLHVPWNLQVITASENSVKANLFQGSR